MYFENKQKNALGWYLIILTVLLPVLLWFISPSNVSIFSLFGMGKILALVGTTLFSLSFILSTRVRVLESIFNGFNRVYEVHSKIGQIGLILLLFHPVFLLSNYVTSPSQAVQFLLPSNNWANNWGIFALGLMLFLIIITLYLRPKYNIWKVTHKFLGLAFFMGAIHIYLVPSDTSQYVPLRIYMLGIVSIGLIAFIYKTLLGKYLVKHFDYKVTGVNKLHKNITEILMEPVYDRLQYVPGQFIFVSFINKKIGTESHPFSITSLPNEHHISIIIKNLGDYTRNISSVPIDTKVKIEGPYGKFNYKNSTNKDQIWIAGGIGITPFISMAKSLLKDRKYKIDLYYSVKTKSEAIKFGELRAIMKELNNTFRAFLYSTEKNGYLSLDLINKASKGIENKDIFICSPPGMVKSFRNNLLERNIPSELIHSEEFNL